MPGRWSAELRARGRHRAQLASGLLINLIPKNSRKRQAMANQQKETTVIVGGGHAAGALLTNAALSAVAA